MIAENKYQQTGPGGAKRKTTQTRKMKIQIQLSHRCLNQKHPLYVYSFHFYSNLLSHERQVTNISTRTHNKYSLLEYHIFFHSPHCHIFLISAYRPTLLVTRHFAILFSYYIYACRWIYIFLAGATHHHTKLRQCQVLRVYRGSLEYSPIFYSLTYKHLHYPHLLFPFENTAWCYFFLCLYALLYDIKRIYRMKKKKIKCRYTIQYVYTYIFIYSRTSNQYRFDSYVQPMPAVTLFGQIYKSSERGEPSVWW